MSSMGTKKPAGSLLIETRSIAPFFTDDPDPDIIVIAAVVIWTEDRCISGQYTIHIHTTHIHIKKDNLHK